MGLKERIRYVLEWNEIRYCMYFVVFSVLLSFILSLFNIAILMTLRAIFGAVFVLFLPGYVATIVFFSREEIDGIERLALSFGLSIALVPLSILIANQIFTRISKITQNSCFS